MNTMHTPHMNRLPTMYMRILLQNSKPNFNCMTFFFRNYSKLYRLKVKKLILKYPKFTKKLPLEWRALY